MSNFLYYLELVLTTGFEVIGLNSDFFWIKCCDKLYKLATRKRIDIQIYNKFRNIMTNRIKKAKAKYYEDEFKKTSLNIKKTWSTINSVIRKNKFKSTIQLTDNNGTKVLESDVSTEFVDYFTNIATNLTNQLPNSPTNPIQYLRSRNISSFVFFCTNAEEIEDIVDDLKDNGTGLNKISNSILKYSNKEISQILSKIINKCILQGYFPQELKSGCITPIYKNGDKTSVKNYRPVCSLSSLSKIIEKVVYNRMLKFIDKHKILSTQQFGFRKKWVQRQHLQIILTIYCLASKTKNIRSLYLWISQKHLMY